MNPKEFAVIGPKEDQYIDKPFETIIIVNNDGSVYSEQKGGKRSVILDTNKLELAGKVALHNHPSNKNNSFSYEDVNLALNHGLREQRVVTRTLEGKKVIYRMIVPETVNLGFNVTFERGRADKPVQRALIQAFQKRYKRIEKTVNTRMKRGISKGEISVDHANAWHYHELWKEAFKGTNIKYERIEI